jgi:diguanylate cyclase (GGDEF)-like protein
VYEGYELSLKGMEGEPVHLSVSVSLRRDANHQPMTYVYLLHDITERREAERRLAHLAHYDQLTGLANRASFLHQLSLALERAKRHNLILGVLAVDLDGFKEINDGFGHSAGDALLRDVAARLRAAVRAEDMVARLGGDEFIVLAAEVNSPGELAIIAQRLLDTLGASTIGTTGIAAKGSVGIALYPQDGESADELLNHADFALYHAKNSGKGCYHFFDSELESIVRAKQRRLDELKNALSCDELVVFYQPQVTSAGAVVGVEALVRWNHPTDGLLAPGAFIPLAEEAGIMPALDAWVMRRACHEVAQWRSQGLVLRLALNVSAQSVGSALVTTVAQVLEESGLPPEALELELTETALLNADDTGVVGVLRELADLGVELSIDDFGTGYGSLVYLRSLPIDAIKIDRCFVQAAPNTPQDAAIVRSLLELGRTLDLRVVGEGVETPQQLELLQRHGCEALQGYWFSPPIPAAQLLQYAGASRPTSSFANSSLVAEDARSRSC